jgi:hypothetical protein
MFLMPIVAETSQYSSVPILGATFDSLDYFMYGMVALMAVFVDVQLFPWVFDFWSMEEADARINQKN